MSHGSIFPSIDSQQLEKKLDCLIESYDLVAVTLTTGDVLLGGVSRHSDEIVRLSFNSSDGQRFGPSCIIDIPIVLIADILLVPLDDSSIPRPAPDDLQVQAFKKLLGEVASTDLLDRLPVDRLPVYHYPNPLASIIYDHNIKVASLQSLTITGYMERALPQDAIPPEGIYLKDDFLFYADWDFFLHQKPGEVSLTAGISSPLTFEITKDVGKSSQQQILQRLSAWFEEGIRRKVSPTMGECGLRGCILVPGPCETTVLEGEECHLCMVVEKSGRTWPILLKPRVLKYPLEFLPRINSELTFYGELLPIPLEVLGEKHEETLLARAIAYFHAS